MQFVRRTIIPDEAKSEVERFEKARSSARRLLESDMFTARSDKRDAAAELFSSQLFILDDPLVTSEIRNFIVTGLVRAEWAIADIFERRIAALRALSTDHIREATLDIDDVAERLYTGLNVFDSQVKFPQGAVIVASELRTSTIVRFRESAVAGLVTEHGGWTSHSSILAREYGIPSVSGIENALRIFQDGVELAVDGFSGEVIIEPAASTLRSLSRKYSSSASTDVDLPLIADGPAATLDGRPVTLRTNTTSAEMLGIAMEHGARGIGLYRSERLIGKFGRLPSEQEQFEAYCEIGEITGADGLRVRIFDVDAESLPGFGGTRQRNPALGMRAVRLGFRNRSLLNQQLRALLRASAIVEIDVVVPMVTGVAEIVALKRMLQEMRAQLEDDGIPCGLLKVGAMIEVPSAVTVVDQIAVESDFLCLGTNDLVQYLLAVDRDNENVSEWFRTLHPAVLRSVKSVIDTCRQLQKHLIVCGEMAGSPFYVPVLIGLGATDLSMSPRAVGNVRRVITGIAFEESAALAKAIEALTTADAVEARVLETARKNWPHLYPEGFLERPFS
jgi:phosphoenolpyruvate-protein phosphotransferase